MPDNEATASPLSRQQKFHAFLRRWCLWTLLRVFLITGIGAGVGTAHHYAQPRLLANARRLISLAGYSHYHLISDHQSFDHQSLLYLSRPGGMDVFCWDVAAKTLKPTTGKAPAPLESRNDLPVAILRNGFLEVRTPGKTPAGHSKGTESSSAPTGKITVGGKSDFSLIHPVFSPDGKRVACVCWTERPDFWLALRHRVQPSFKVRTTTYASVYVSAIAGTQTQYLGSVPAFPERNSPYRQSGKTSYSLSEVHWLADSRHLAFAYGDGFYVIEVP